MAKKFLTLGLCIGILWFGNSGCSKSCTELKLDMLDDMAAKCEAAAKDESTDATALLTKFNELGLEVKAIEQKVNEAQPECNGKKVELTPEEKQKALDLTKKITASMLVISAKVQKASMPR
ncbi:hypothetical protein LBMAG35_15530 [Chlorobiota bacterium]|nr:hypothetical protein LBMAG35_15530 [Chlorobiota bacterium]